MRSRARRALPRPLRASPPPVFSLGLHFALAESAAQNTWDHSRPLWNILPSPSLLPPPQERQASGTGVHSCGRTCPLASLPGPWRDRPRASAFRGHLLRGGAGGRTWLHPSPLPTSRDTSPPSGSLPAAPESGSVPPTWAPCWPSPATPSPFTLPFPCPAHLQVDEGEDSPSPCTWAGRGL